MKHVFVAVVTVVLCCSAGAVAQTPPPDPIREVLPQIDVVMAHQDALALSEAQKSAIQASVLTAQGRFIPAQRRLEEAVKKLVVILRPGRIDPTRALTQLDVVLDRERAIKREQLRLMIEVKDELTPAQQEMARRFATTGTK
jgi:hypothetical protein